MSHRSSILLIEDDPAIVVTLRRLLAEEGHQVAIETRGDAGLARAQTEKFDVIITDMKLPGLNGLNLVRELHLARPRLPIILITAYGTTETAIEATKSGAYDYLVKPFEIPELIELVEHAEASHVMPWWGTAGSCSPSTRRSGEWPPSRLTFSSAAKRAPARS
jgi:DNA-binding NtrC family response regulator